MLTVRQTTPRIVQIGADETLDLRVYSSASAVQTASAATVAITAGGASVLPATSASVVTPTATYALASAATSALGPNSAWLERWAVTIGGTAYTFQRAGYLVRTKFFPTITDDDLLARHSDLLQIVPDADLGQWREAAREKIERDLLKGGKRPWLIFDSWALTDAHLSLTLAMFYRDAASSIGGGRYKDLSAEYQESYHKEFDSVSFRQDSDESGTMTSGAVQSTARAPIILTGGPAGRYW